MKTLIVDDETRFATFLRKALEAEGLGEVATASSAEEALSSLRESRIDLVVTDLKMGGMSGLELLAEVKRMSGGTDVILMTAFADVETAREALKRGALDYLVKPFDNDELVSLVKQVADRRALATESDDAAAPAFAGMIGTGAAMRNVFNTVEKAAHTDATVLVLGESGTGKELIAKAIHSLGVRHAGPFVDVNCAAIPATLIESELFGHERGAFTGAHASRKGRIEASARGTLFLDEIAEMPLELQPKLLRFLQERTIYRVGGNEPVNVDTRIVAATNRDLDAEVGDGRFREDLFYRLAVVRIEMPALRDRLEDIRPLATHFLSRRGRSAADLTDEAVSMLEAYGWPGNVRELENVIEQAVFQSGDGPVRAEHLPRAVVTGRGAAVPEDAPAPAPTDLNLASNERRLIEEALQKASGNKSKAAELLGISRRKLYSRMSLLGMDGSDTEDADQP